MHYQAALCATRPLSVLLLSHIPATSGTTTRQHPCCRLDRLLAAAGGQASLDRLLSSYQVQPSSASPLPATASSPP
eukprot:3237291-Rhodomonas_salina.1